MVPLATWQVLHVDGADAGQACPSSWRFPCTGIVGKAGVHASDLVSLIYSPAPLLVYLPVQSGATVGLQL